MADRGAVANSRYMPRALSTRNQFVASMWVNTIASGSTSPDSRYFPGNHQLTISFGSVMWSNTQAAAYGPRAATKSFVTHSFNGGTFEDAAKYNRAGGFTGVITKHSIVQPNVRVFLLLRRTMTVIGSTWTDANGRYTFTGYDTSSLNAGNYVIQVSDPELENYANLGRLDRMTAG